MIFKLSYYYEGQEKYSGSQGNSKQSVGAFINFLREKQFPAEKISDDGKCFLIDTKGTALHVRTQLRGGRFIISELYFGHRILAVATKNLALKRKTNIDFWEQTIVINYIYENKINFSLTDEKTSEEAELIERFFKKEWSNWKCSKYSPRYFMESESQLPLEEKVEVIVKKLCGFHETEEVDNLQCIKIKRVTCHIIGEIRERKKEEGRNMAKDQLLKLLEKVLPDDPKKDSKKYALLREMQNKIKNFEIKTDDELRAAARNAIILCVQCRSIFTFSGKTTSGKKILAELSLFKNNKYEYGELRDLIHLTGDVAYADLLKINTNVVQSDTLVAKARRTQYYSSFSKHLMYKAYADSGINDNRLFSENISRKPSR